jgi:transposase-like protein
MAKSRKPPTWDAMVRAAVRKSLKAGGTVSDLAVQSGVSRQVIEQWRGNRRKKLRGDNLEKVAASLGFRLIRD